MYMNRLRDDDFDMLFRDSKFNIIHKCSKSGQDETFPLSNGKEFICKLTEKVDSIDQHKLCSEMIRLSDKVLVKRFSLIKCELLRKKSQLLFKNKLIDEIKKYFELYEWWDKELLNHKIMKFISNE